MQFKIFQFQLILINGKSVRQNIGISLFPPLNLIWGFLLIDLTCFVLQTILNSKKMTTFAKLKGVCHEIFDLQFFS